MPRPLRLASSMLLCFPLDPRHRAAVRRAGVVHGACRAASPIALTARILSTTYGRGLKQISPTRPACLTGVHVPDTDLVAGDRARNVRDFCSITRKRALMRPPSAGKNKVGASLDD